MIFAPKISLSLKLEHLLPKIIFKTEIKINLLSEKYEKFFHRELSDKENEEKRNIKMEKDKLGKITSNYRRGLLKKSKKENQKVYVPIHLISDGTKAIIKILGDPVFEDNLD